MTVHKLSDKESELNVFISRLNDQLKQSGDNWRKVMQHILDQIEQFKINHQDDEVSVDYTKLRTPGATTSKNISINEFLGAFIEELNNASDLNRNLVYMTVSGTTGKTTSTRLKTTFENASDVYKEIIFGENQSSGAVEPQQFEFLQDLFSVVKNQIKNEHEKNMRSDSNVVNNSINLLNYFGESLGLENVDTQKANEAASWTKNSADSAQSNLKMMSESADEKTKEKAQKLAEKAKLAAEKAAEKALDIEEVNADKNARSFESAFVNDYAYILNNYGANSMEAYVFLENRLEEINLEIHLSNMGSTVEKNRYSGLNSQSSSDDTSTYLGAVYDKIKESMDFIEPQFKKAKKKKETDEVRELGNINDWLKFDELFADLNFTQCKKMALNMSKDFKLRGSITDMKVIQKLQKIDNLKSVNISDEIEVKIAKDKIRSYLKSIYGLTGMSNDEIQQKKSKLTKLSKSANPDENAYNISRKPSKGKLPLVDGNVILSDATKKSADLTNFNLSADEVKSFLSVIRSQYLNHPASQNRDFNKKSFFKFLDGFESMKVAPKKMQGSKEDKLSNFLFKLALKIKDLVEFTDKCYVSDNQDEKLRSAGAAISAYFNEDKKGGLFSSNISRRGLTYFSEIAKEFENVDAMCTCLIGKRNEDGALSNAKDYDNLKSFFHKLLNEGQSLALEPAKLAKSQSGPSSHL